MNFDSKSYLYGKYKELIGWTSTSDDSYEEMINLLGEFEIKPGSIKTKEVNYVKSIEFKPKILDNDFICNYFNFNLHGNIEMSGYEGNTSFLIKDREMVVLVNTNDEKAGLYCIDLSNSYDTKVHYYNMDVVNSLRNDYSMNLIQILGLNAFKLKNLGFNPPDNTETYSNVDREKIKYFAIHEYHDNNIDSLLELLDKANDKGSK
jgi:hypothetical protein